jgi:predicted nucleic acid-binding protein
VRIIVSDTSPIRALHHLGLLNLLPDLFEEIVIPPRVLQELESPRRRFSPVQLAAYPWLKLRSPANRAQVQELLKEVDLGEAEAIALAVELHAEVLIDEAEGREVAKRIGLSLVGALGILVRLKQSGLITTVLPLIDRLETELRFFVADPLRTEIRRLVGE